MLLVFYNRIFKKSKKENIPTTEEQIAETIVSE
jgi:hypothetical protein